MIRRLKSYSRWDFFQSLFTTKHSSPICPGNPLSAKRTSASRSREPSPPFMCEHSKNPTIGGPKMLLEKVLDYLNCKMQPGDLHTSDLGCVPSSRAPLHGSSSISQLLRQFSSSTWTLPSVSKANIYSLLQYFTARYLGFWQILTGTATIPIGTHDPYLMPTAWLRLKIFAASQWL